MVWVVDDLAEAALGPWGLAAAVGVGVIAATRRRRAAAAADGAPASAWTAAGLGGVLAVAEGVRERIQATRHVLGDFDPFGDFDMLFGARRMNLKILEVPVRYAARTYGETNISRFRHGLLLLRMSAFAARKLKFV